MEGLTSSLSDQWALVVGFLMPLLIAVLNRGHWQNYVKAIVAFVSCLVAATGEMYFTGRWDGTFTTPAATFLTIFTVAIATYESWWKKVGVSDWLTSNVNAGTPPPTEVSVLPPKTP